MSDICSDNGSNISVNSAILSGAIAGVVGPPGPPGCPQIACATTITVPTPGRFYLGYFNTETSIDKIIVIQQGATPQVVYNLKHGADLSGLGTALFAANRTDTDVATGAVLTAADFEAGTETISAGSHLWMDINYVLSDVVIVAVVHTPTCTDSASGQGVPVEDYSTNTTAVPLTDI